MRFPPEFLERLRDEIATSEVVSRKVNLRLKGKEHSGLCPFHQEKTPSFTVNDSKGFYHCFGCGAHGDIVKFVMETEGLNFSEAVAKLAEDYSIPLPKIEENRVDTKEEEERKQLYAVMEETCRIFESNLYSKDGKGALQYLQRRGLNNQNIQKFRLGFAVNSFDYLINELKGRGFSEDILLKAGLVSRNDRGKLYDKFRNRVMFTILDKKERVVAFSGRVLDDSKPKYMNSPETKLYHKGSIVYNYAFARKPAYDAGNIIAVEGNMDVISVYVNGVENVVAPMGTAVTQNQVKELWKVVDEVVFCMDGDAAGIKATKRISELVLPIINPQKTIKFSFMPAGEDPDTFIKRYGKDAFKKLINKAESLSEFIWENERDIFLKNNEPEEKARLEDALNKKISLISDASIKNHFRAFYKNKLWNLGRFIAKKKNTTNKEVKNLQDLSEKEKKEKFHINKDNDKNIITSTTHQLTNFDKFEREIIAILISHPELINYNPTDYLVRDFHFYNEKFEEIVGIIHEIADGLLDSLLVKYSDLEELTTPELEKLEKVKKNIVEALENKGLNYYIRYSQRYFNKRSIKSLKASLSILFYSHDLEKVIEEKKDIMKESDIDFQRLSLLQNIENNLRKEIKLLKSDLQFT